LLSSDKHSYFFFKGIYQGILENSVALLQQQIIRTAASIGDAAQALTGKIINSY
jgi:hypothetical protein